MNTPLLHTRREFLARGISLAAATATVPAWLHRTALAEEAFARRAGERVLVVVQLGGGNDGLNTLAPFGHDAYQRARPDLRLKPDDVLKLNDEVGLHPKMAPFKSLYDDGDAAIVQGVGYPNPNRSHFRSMEIWHTASDADKIERYGWLGRYFDNECKGEARAVAGVALGNEAPQAFTNPNGLGITFAKPDAFQWNPSMANAGKGLAHSELKAFKSLTAASRGEADFLTRTALNAQLTSDRVRAMTTAHAPKSYPNNRLASQLKLIAGLIRGDLGTRIYYCGISGFDTHAGQAPRHAALLDQFASSVKAFLDDLKAQGNASRVLVLAFSEFGRRVEENASDGTDHGVAAPMFLAGGGIKPGLYGKAPSLTDLDDGDVKAGVDFRQVYATVLDNFLGASSEKILGRRFEKLSFC